MSTLTPHSDALSADPRTASAGRHRELGGLISQADWGAADRDQVLDTLSRISSGDPDSWTLEWIWTAGQAWATANTAATAGHTAQAATAFLHAATSYGAALRYLPLSRERDRWPALWQRHRDCWERAIDLHPYNAQRLQLPYKHTTLPAYLFTAPGTRGPRPLIIIHNGASAPTPATWGLGGAAATQRGYHWLTFDGPGQQSAFHDRRLVFRPDWEAVLTPVLDTVTRLPGVDPRRIAAIGIGQAGYWLPQALQYEHRLAAVALEPGVVDVRTAWEDLLGDELTALHRSGQRSAFQRALHAELLFDPPRALNVDTQAAPYGHSHRSLFKLLTELTRYRLPPHLNAVQTPLLSLDTGNRSRWPGQAHQLAHRTPLPTAVRAAPDPALATQQALDWIETFLGG